MKEQMEERPLRGIVPTKLDKSPLYTMEVAFRLSDLPRWRPKTTGDYGRASREEDSPAEDDSKTILGVAKMPCECYQCQRHRREYKAIENRDVDELIGLVEDLEDQIMHVQLDADWAKWVLNSGDPDARAELEEALARITKREEEGQGTMPEQGVE